MDFEKFSSVSWYPGHMLKAERQLKEKLKLIDIVVELIDARAPYSSINNNLAESVKHKAVLYVLAKSDLADQETTVKWLNYFRSRGDHAISLHHRQKDAIKKLQTSMLEIAKKDRAARGATTPLLRALRAVIIGLPNVGKSSLINAIVKRKQAQTGPRPGVTRHQQWVKINKDLELLDTPGVMMPSVPNPETGFKLGVVACIRDKIVGVEHLSDYLLYQWKRQGCCDYFERYDLQEHPDHRDELLDLIGKRMGFLRDAKHIDREKSANQLLQDFRDGLLGRISLESPDELT